MSHAPSHAAWHDRLGPYLDGELSHAEETLVRQHLPGCAACLERLEQLTRLSSSIRSMPREQMPGDLKSAILERTRAVPRARFVTPWRLTSLAAAAVAVIVAATVWRANPPPPAARPLTEGHDSGDISSSDKAADTKSAPVQSIGSSPARESVQTGAAAVAPPSDAPRSRMDRLETDRRKTSRSGAALKDAPVKEAANVIARYAATVVLEAGLPVRLTPIVPQESSHGIQPEARQQPEPTAKALTARPAMADDGGSVITFLVKVDTAGKILSADPIGARTQTMTVVESARALLVGATLTSFGAGRTMSVVVEVTVPAS